MLTESLALSFAAGFVGFLASLWLMTLASQVRMPFPMPVTYDFRPDAKVLMLTLAVSALTGILFGLAPALQATRTDLVPALKQGANVLFRGNRRLSLRNLLIVWQVAASITLLVVLGLLSVGIQTTLGIQAGFNPKNLYAVSLDPVRDGYSGAQAEVFFRNLVERVKANRDVERAALTETVPVSLPGSWMRVSAPSREGNVSVGAIKHVVGRDYFETAGIPMIFGRSFGVREELETSTSVIVNQALAEELWKNDGAVGRWLEIGNVELAPPKGLWPGSFDYRPAIVGNELKRFNVIGVATNVAEGLVVGKANPAVYFPLRPSSYSRPSLQGVTLLVRVLPGVDGMALMQHEVAAIDQHVRPTNARSIEGQISEFMAPLRMAAWTYALIGFFGVVLAGVGLAGVTAYSIVQRTREIGIRVALGATRMMVLHAVMKDGLILIASGVAIGLCGALAGARMLASMNSSVGTVTSTSTSDPAVLIGAPLLLAALGLGACYLPARRSTRIDPVVALRQE